MSKPKQRVATALALLFIVPFAAGMVRAAEPAKAVSKPAPTAEKMAAPSSDKPPPPTIDSNNDGKADAWDRDANGIADAWDVNGDGKPDLMDDNGDGKPDEGKAPPPPPESDGKPQ
jgi:hypothetical protein